ncbi:MAG: hypothetical protein MUE34_12030, partial [Acidimicrobiales bacterium]|nr:hypothetical protein [Acidimicrobiales bacterium]
MPSFLKQRPRTALALLGGAAVLLIAVASVTLLREDEDSTGADAEAAPSTTAPVAEPDEGVDGSAGSGLGGSATTTTAIDAPPGTEADSGTESGAVPDRPPLSGNILVDAPPVQEGPPEEGAPEPTPISEGAALACAQVEFAVDAWDADDLGAYQSHLAEAVALATGATEPAIGAAVPALEEASGAEDPAPGITRFLEACVASGYA